MAFPEDPLGVRLWAQLGGAWTDLTPDLQLGQRVTITRGRPDESARTDYGRCRFTLKNRDGRYSPGNPRSPYFGLLGRNTPMYVSVHAGSAYLRVPGAGADYASTPDAAALDISGDLDLRVDAAVTNWAAAGSVEVAGKFDYTGNDKSWLLLWRDGRPHFEWSADGTTTVQTDATAAPTVRPGNRLAVRVTLDVNNGASGNTVTYYTAPTLAGPWQQLGDPVTTAGTTSVHNSAAAVQLGNASTTLAFPVMQGRVYGMELRNGINGPVVACPDFTLAQPGTPTLTDAAGRTWTVHGGAIVTNERIRFRGEIPTWPLTWGPSGRNVTVQVEAAGILRRLGQGSGVLASPLFRRITSTDIPTPVAYWSCEDGPTAERAAAGVSGAPPMLTNVALPLGDVPTPPRFSAVTGPPGSAPLPDLAEFSSLVGAVAGGTAASWTVEMVVQFTTDAVSALPLTVTMGSAGSLYLFTNPNDGGTLGGQFHGVGYTDTDQPVFFAAAGIHDGAWHHVRVTAAQSGANVALTVWVDGTLGVSATQTASTLGRVSSIGVNTNGSPFVASAGHVAVWSPAITADTYQAVTGYTGETAPARIVRLPAEQGVAAVAYAADDVEALGPQGTDRLVNILSEASDADGGALFEQRDALGLAYRDRATLYNQPVRLALVYAGRGHAPPFEPAYDDQGVHNDVTVTRKGGSSSRATLDEGPLSTLDPPAGIGRYDQTVTLNLATDEQAGPQAEWRLHLGTWDDYRYPQVRVLLHKAAELIDAAADIDTGDRLTVEDLPEFLPPGPADLLAQSYTETLGVRTWEIVYNCTPAGLWTVGVLGDDLLGRADTDGTELGAAIAADDTTLPVTVTDGPLWVIDPAEFPFDIRLGGGEVATATGCVDLGGTQQAMTVVRGVNGVRRGWPAGAAVRLATPMILSL